MAGFWVLLFVIIVLIAVLPAWPYSRQYGYTPAGALLAVLVLFLAFVWLGWIVMAWPWVVPAT